VGHFGLPIDLTERREQEHRIRLQIYEAITELAEKRDNETGLHLKRIARTSQLVARALELPAAFVADIATFAPLHDIGKVGISDAVLLAPRKLTVEEFEVMKSHSEIGWEILRGCPTLEMAAEIVRHHHERWDGTGYPLGLAGGEIPLAARIVSVADVYDALRSRRPYKEPWPHEKAVATITAGSGTQFDPTVVEAFLDVAEQCEEVSERLQDTVPEPEASPAEANERSYRSAV
jgi:response regulator RpfG family c-di-GMP phosphodiesterase